MLDTKGETRDMQESISHHIYPSGKTLVVVCVYVCCVCVCVCVVVTNEALY